MGGDSTFAIRVWIALGIVSYVYGIVWLYWTFQSEDLTRGQFANNVVWYTAYIIWGPLPILRGWLLIHRFRRAAHRELIFMALCFGFLHLARCVLSIFTYSLVMPTPLLVALNFASYAFFSAVAVYVIAYAAAAWRGRYFKACGLTIYASSYLACACCSYAAWSVLVEAPGVATIYGFQTIFWAYIADLFRRLRRETKRRAAAVVARDLAAYDAIWATLSRDGDFVAQLADVEAALGGEREDPLAAPAAPGSALARALGKLRRARALAGTAKPRQYVDDLAVLFAQAAALNGHFQDLVAARVAVAGGRGAAAAVKSRARAIEKLYRSYNGDASRLVDLVRASVVYDDVAALATAIRTIRADPELVVVGRKNSLSLAHDSRTSAGYRNVALSILVIDPFTTSHGLETHVCELQLGLKDIEALRDDTGHANYIAWRDINAE